MAELGAFFPLCAFGKNTSGALLRIGEDANQVILTHSSKHISLYNVAEQKLLASWTVRGGHQLTSAVICNRASHQFFGVTDGKTVRKWKQDDTSVEKAKKVHVSRPVHSLVDAAGEVPLALLDDGSLIKLNENLTTVIPSKLTTNDSIIWADVLQENDKCFVAFIAKQVKSSSLECFVYQIVSKTQETTCLHQTKIEAANIGDCKGFSFTVSSRDSNVFILTGNKKLYKCSLGSVSTPEEVAMPPLVGEPAMVMLDSSQIAITGVKGQNGAGGLGVWDTKFSILHSWQAYPQGHANAKQVVFKEDNLLVELDGKVFVYPVTLKTSSLGAALGRLSSQVTAETSHNEQSDLDELVESLCNTSTKIKSTKFKQGLTQCISMMKEKHMDISLVQDKLSLLVLKCIADKSEVPKAQLQQLIATGMLPGSLAPRLFPILIEHKELILLKECLGSIYNIPEKSLVQCLACFLSCSEEESLGISAQEADEGIEIELENSTACKQNVLLNQLLILPTNSVFMVECLQSLEFPHVLKLIKYLHNLLKTSSPSTVKTTETKTKPPSVLEIVEWLSNVLDAHFTQIILSPEAKEVLVELHEMVQEQVNFYDELVCLETILSQIRSSSVVSQKQKIGRYSICTLHIP